MIELLTRIRQRCFERTVPEVLVLGNQKSGTTVIAAGLAECAGVSASLDLHAIHTPRMTAAYVNRSLTVAKIMRRCRGRFRATVVKEPILTFYAEELLQRLPTTRFVFIVRDPRDNIRSILNRLKLRGDQDSLTAAQWASIPAAWREVIENRRLGFSCDHYVESLARRWMCAWQLCSIMNERMVTVRYEDFLTDKSGFLRQLTRRVGLLARVDSPTSVNKQFQERGDRDAHWPTFFGKNLTAINAVCRSAMSKLGYDLERTCAELVGAQPKNTFVDIAPQNTSWTSGANGGFNLGDLTRC